MTIPEANKALGIRTEITLVESSEASAGTVIDQSHEPGTKTHHDDIVRLTVAGPLTVPDIVGMNKSDAWAKLGAAGFDSDYTFDPTSTEPAGNVLSQEPAPGTQVMDLVVSFVIAGANPNP